MAISTASAPTLGRHFGIPGFSALVFLVAGTLLLGNYFGNLQGALFLVGGALGISLYHAAFGFTSAWRVFIMDGRGRGLRVQMILLALAVVLFFPALADGVLFGNPVRGLVRRPACP